MKLEFMYLRLAGIVLTTATLLLYPLLKGEAQQSQENAKKQNEALQKVRENVTASMFYDNVQAKDSDWNLKYAFIRDSTSLLFEKGSKNITIHIREYNSVEEAKKDFSIPAFNARVEQYKEQGDEGRKIYSIYGKGGFSSLEFRKGRFIIYVDCKKDEETAKRFAGYASDAITQ